jgi:hypothetical protein
MRRSSDRVLRADDVTRQGDIGWTRAYQDVLVPDKFLGVSVDYLVREQVYIYICRPRRHATSTSR